MTENESGRSALLEHTTDIVAAYVAHNSTPSSDLPNVLRMVYEKLTELGKPPVKSEPERVPAVAIKKSVQSDFIICLECGVKQKMLKRHLAVAHGLTPEEYRARWQLAFDYPTIAPSYTEKRRAIAKQIGLGRKAAKPAKPTSRRRKKS